MDKFIKTAKTGVIFIVAANFIMAIGLVIFGYAMGSPLPFYGAIAVFLAGIALIFIMKNALKKYQEALDKNKND